MTGAATTTSLVLVQPPSAVPLALYDNACAAIAKARVVDEAKDIHDKFVALRAYARQAKNRDLEITAVEIRIRAERRLGQLLAVAEKAKGTRNQLVSRGVIGGSKNEPPISCQPTLASQGIDKKLSSRAQKLGAIPEEKFNARIFAWRERAEQTDGIVRVDLLNQGAHVGHNTGETEWYTPLAIMEAARRVMGGIDCDPASTARANEVIQAERFIDAKTNGLKTPWGKRVWLNPPYRQPLLHQFADVVVSRYQAGEIEQACVLVNNATETASFQKLFRTATAICFPAGRVKFWGPDGRSAAPLQGQALFYFGHKVQDFITAFAPMGCCAPLGKMVSP